MDLPYLHGETQQGLLNICVDQFSKDPKDYLNLHNASITF